MLPFLGSCLLAPVLKPNSYQNSETALRRALRFFLSLHPNSSITHDLAPEMECLANPLPRMPTAHSKPCQTEQHPPTGAFADDYHRIPLVPGLGRADPEYGLGEDSFQESLAAGDSEMTGNKTKLEAHHSSFSLPI